MDSPIILNLLWLVPIAAWYITRNQALPKQSIIRGVSFGLVISPASLGLYTLYYVDPLAAIIGMLGLALSLFHGSVGYQAAIALNLIPSHTVVKGSAHIPIELINALFWAVIYGLIGFSYGYYKIKKNPDK